ncbi:Protein of unknown function [Gryllus bimaculatus]|nr:Protein of unknown function [Gryllus bimaculatus]
MSSVNAAERQHAQEEYGAQLHKWSPYKLYNNVVEIMKTVVEEGMEGWEHSLKKFVPECNNVNVCSILKSELYASVDRSGPELMNAIKQSLSIPRDFLLPEDEVQRQQYTDQDLEDMHKITAELIRRYQYNEQLISVLEAERDILEEFKGIDTKVAEWQELKKKSWDEAAGMKDQINLLRSKKGHGFDTPRTSTILNSLCANLND